MKYKKCENVERPDFPNVKYDFRNKSAELYRGVGESGKTGKMGSSTDPNVMPKEQQIKGVPIEYEE